jgi:hypothetical protein
MIDPQSVGEIRKLLIDGTPLSPSATLAQWREEGAATPFVYGDGHHGLIINRYELAKLILEDNRFSQKPIRIPVHQSSPEESDADSIALGTPPG